MLQILTDLLKVNRLELTATAGLIASGVMGTWAQMTGSSNGCDLPTAGNLAFPIWTESYRDGEVGWTGDVGITGKVTLLYGKFRAITDQVTGTPAVNAVLYAAADGTLSTTAGNGIVVAVCTKASHSVTYLGTTFTACIEFVTI